MFTHHFAKYSVLGHAPDYCFVEQVVGIQRDALYMVTHNQATGHIDDVALMRLVLFMILKPSAILAVSEHMCTLVCTLIFA